MLFSALTMAHAGGTNSDKDKSTKHHSRCAKLAFWRHYKDADKNAKQAQIKQAPSKRAPQAETARIKAASAKQAASQRDQKQGASKSKPSAQKAPAANRKKPDPATASSNQ